MRRDRSLRLGLGSLLLAGGALFLQVPHLVNDIMIPAALRRGGMGLCLAVGLSSMVLGAAAVAAGAWLCTRHRP